MKNINFGEEDDEDLEERIDKTNKIPINKIIKNEKIEKIDTKKRKKNKKDSLPDQQNFKENIPLEEQEFIEFVLMDFRQPEELNNFSNMKSLSLIQQNIKNISDISCCTQAQQLEFLCLNENLIEGFNSIDKFKSLKELQINYNFIEKLENIDKLENLEKLWVCENKIKKIENLPNKISNLWIATNCIEYLEEDFLNYENIIELNISGNALSSFKDLFILSKFPKLKVLNLNDPNFGENPICLINNYRLYIVHKIPNLIILDEINITKDEKEEFENSFFKKSNFYKNKIQQLNRISKLCFKMLKIFGWFFKLMKIFQIYFFRKRIKMLEYIQYERESQKIILSLQKIKKDKLSFLRNNSSGLNEFLNQSVVGSSTNLNGNIAEDEKIKENKSNAQIPTNDNITEDELIEEMGKEIDITNDKIKKCFSNVEMIDTNYRTIKHFITEVNDYSIICNFYELESAGNLKLEPGFMTDKWAISCIELMKNRTSQNFLNRYSIKNINVMKVWKIINKPKKIIFDNNYDYLIDLNNKFGEEKKYYDFFFMFLEDQNLENITKNLFDNFNFENNEKEIPKPKIEKNRNKLIFEKNNCEIKNLLKNNDLTMFSTYSDKFEELKIKSLENDKNKRLYTVICKCINFENLIKTSEDSYDEESSCYDDLESIIQNNSEANYFNIQNNILEIKNNHKDKSIYVLKNKTLFIPEYLIEYNYNYNNINLNSIGKSQNTLTRSKFNNVLLSSYTQKESNSMILKDEYIHVFNNSLKSLLNCEIKNSIPDEIINKYSICKFQFLDELNTTELFFSKNTILNYLHISHKYSNIDSFNEEFNKILEKLDEIKNLNFKNPLVTINPNNTLKSNEDSNINNNIDNFNNYFDNNSDRNEINENNKIINHLSSSINSNNVSLVSKTSQINSIQKEKNEKIDKSKKHFLKKF